MTRRKFFNQPTGLPVAIILKYKMKKTHSIIQCKKTVHTCNNIKWVIARDLQEKIL